MTPAEIRKQLRETKRERQVCSVDARAYNNLRDALAIEEITFTRTELTTLRDDHRLFVVRALASYALRLVRGAIK